MGRVALACLGVVAVLAGAAPPIAAASAPPSRATLQDFACHRSSDSLNRWIAVTAVMRPVTGTQHMAMRFQLLRRAPHSSRFTDVSGGDLGRWIRPTNPSTLGSQPGDHWTVQKQVVNLSSPAVYRFRVGFRWFGSGGQTLQTVFKLSPLCSQT